MQVVLRIFPLHELPSSHNVVANTISIESCAHLTFRSMQKRVHGVPFTQHMMNSLAEIEKKVLNHEVMQAHFNETLMQHAGYEQRIVAVESQILKVINYAEQDKAEAPRTTGFSMCGAYGAGIAAAAQQAGTGTARSSAARSPQSS